MAFPEDSAWARISDYDPAELAANFKRIDRHDERVEKTAARNRDLEDVYNELQDLASTLHRGYAIDADLQDLIQRIYGMLR